MPTKHLPVIDEIKKHLSDIGLPVDSYNFHLHKKFMYATFLCRNTIEARDTTVLAKVNTDNSYKLYVELD